MAIPHFRLPLNLPHAATVAVRIRSTLTRVAPRRDPAHAHLHDLAEQLCEMLAPCRFLESNPPPVAAKQLTRDAARITRQLVQAIAACRLADDRLGQCVRNLFECLAKGAEGARLSLIAGENPASPQRPRDRKLPPLDSAEPASPTPTPAPRATAAHRRPLLPLDAVGRPHFQPPPPRPVRTPRKKVNRPLDAIGRPVADPGVAPDLPPPGPATPPDDRELGPPIDETEFTREPAAAADPAAAGIPADSDVPLTEDDLGPPLEDDGELDTPLTGPGRRTGGIIHDDEDDSDWSFDE